MKTLKNFWAAWALVGSLAATALAATLIMRGEEDLV